MPQNIIAIVARIRCPMINDESVMKKTKKTKVSDFRKLKKSNRISSDAARYPRKVCDI